ncbi:zinc ribbon domain-containing protein [Dictyobacter halimunensis]|uniref:zinc ribbon domain-containing protein n=1 Tax=Dictyobacter halimunensis TaxID=3026934 RepID=UPI003B986F43
MLCPGCQAPIESDAVFCGHCGSPLPPVHLRSGVEAPAQMQAGKQWVDEEASESAAQGQTHQPFVSPAYPLTPIPASKASGSTPSPAPLPFAGAPPCIVPIAKRAAPLQVAISPLSRSFSPSWVLGSRLVSLRYGRTSISPLHSRLSPL